MNFSSPSLTNPSKPNAPQDQSTSTIHSTIPSAVPTNATKLRLLREHDLERRWDSLEDKRICVVCGMEFEGSQIRIRVRLGKPVFQCPNPECDGTLGQFAHLGNPLLSEETWSDWMRALGPEQHDVHPKRGTSPRV